MSKSPEKKYTFKEGFTIEVRLAPEDTYYAMGDLEFFEVPVFDLYIKDKFLQTYDTFEEAKKAGMEMSL